MKVRYQGTMSVDAPRRGFWTEKAKAFDAWVGGAWAGLRRLSAQMWMRFYRAIQAASAALTKRIRWIIAIIAAGLVAASVLMASRLQLFLATYFNSTDAIAGLKDVVVNTGAALIGAAAFAFTLIMFAMQVNVERMPHGLFRKFSSDPALLATFLGSVACALWVTASPVLLRPDTLAIALLSAGWATLLLFALFLVAYRRALRLISPTDQLQMIVRASQHDMNRWRRIADRTRALFEGKEPERDKRLGPSADLPLTTFFQLHTHWTARAEQSLTYAIAFSRRFAEQGDHEVADVALQALLAINATYVRVKSRTFFAQHLLLDNPWVTDGFINTTLEHLRQNIQIALARRDERAISQNLRALAGLTKVYLTIDYGGDHNPKTHALLVGGYLSDAVKSLAPHNFPDLLMEGVRLLGSTAQAFLDARQFTDLGSFGSYIATIGAAGVARSDHRPVLLTAVGQLAKLTFNMLRAKDADVRFPLGEIKKNVSALTQLCLATPDGQLGSGHSFYLAPYYSGTTHQSLLAELHELINALIEAKADDKAARSVLRNIEVFSGDLYRIEKEVMLASIEQKSSFTFDILHWISSVSILLWAAAGADACDLHTKKELQKHGLWLASVLTWIPDETEAIAVIERYQPAETFFDLAFEAHRRVGPGRTADNVNDMQISWAIRSAAYGAHWGSFDQSMCGIAVMSLWRNDSNAMLDKLRKDLAAAKTKPSQELLDQAAHELRRRSERLWEERHHYSHIGAAMAVADHAALEPLLKAVADVLSPDTAG